MNWIGWLLTVYAAGFFATFAFNACLGPITPGMSLLRAVVWPIHWATGWPRGPRVY